MSLRQLPLEAIASPPPGRARLITSFLICVYLVWQVAVPLSYYFGDDKSDERFAWRMFSATWLIHRTCRVSVNEWVIPGADNTMVIRDLDLHLAPTINKSWINLLGRNRAAVVDKFLHARCSADHSVIEVRFFRSCGGADGSRIASTERALSCKTGVLSRTRGSP